jgi:hypothetical protein
MKTREWRIYSGVHGINTGWGRPWACNQPKEFEMRKIKPSPALLLAFVALFVAMGGAGYAASKMKTASVKTKNIRSGAVTTDKLADGAVTTPKLAPDAVAPNARNAQNAVNASNAMNAVNAQNANTLGGVAPGHCQTGWLKVSAVIDTAGLTDANPDAVVPGFDCASNAPDAIQIHREGVGIYTVTFAGIGSGTAVSSSNVSNAVTAASRIENGSMTVKVWNNGDAQFVDGKAVDLIAF